MKRTVHIKNRLWRVKRWAVLITAAVFIPVSGSAQSLFESAVGEGTASGEAAYDLGGRIRSGLFGNEEESRLLYSDVRMEIQVPGTDNASGFADIRFRAQRREETESELLVREGYIDLCMNAIDVRVGRQIVVWGRADGFNPTDNISATDWSVLSPDEDDKRIANFVVKSVVYVDPFSLEFDWIPVPESSVLPLENIELPSGIAWADERERDTIWRDGAVAVKLNVETAGFDGSVSYYNGYANTAGITYSIEDSAIVLKTDPYRMQIVGFDFSTALDRWGVRGEFAYSFPGDEPDQFFSIPLRQVEGTIGIDREWSDFGLITQYVGIYVFDDPVDTPDSLLAAELSAWNRMLFSQQETWSHAVSVRPSLSLFHSVLTCDALGLFNFSTEEFFVIPKVTYAVRDGVNLTFGVQYFAGPDGTLYDTISETRNAGFAELELSF